MKAPKISFDAAKLQQLLLQHVEKIVLGVVLLVVAYFVYAGAALPRLDPNKTPDQMTQEANNVKIEINNPDHWRKIEEKRRKTYPVQELVKQGQVANLSRPYDGKQPIKIPDFAKASLRTDPKILPPKNTKVVVFHGPLAVLPRAGDTDTILATEFAGAGGEGAGPRQPIVQRPQPGGAGSRRPSSTEGGGRTTPRTKQGRGSGGVLEEGGMEMSFQPQMGFGSQPGERTLPPEAQVGFRPSSEVVLKEARAVVVMAAVPLEAQYEEFDKAFKEALDYDPVRDVPRYITFRVERADVTADPNQDPDQAKWESLSTRAAITETLNWGPSPQEVVDPNAIDPLILTHRVPPFVQRDIYEALVHPDIPLFDFSADPNAPQAAPDANPQPQPDDEFGDGNPLTGLQPQAMGEGRMQPGVRMPNPYGSGPRGMQGYGEGQFGGGATEETIAKYRLIRFTDTTVQPKRKYRYRVRVVVEDPNNPCLTELAQKNWDPGRTQPFRKPPIQSVTESVKKRRDARDAKDKYPFMLESDPSEPSEIVELPEVNHYFAGSVTPGKGNALRPGTPPILTSQPTAKLLTVAWDAVKAVDVPAEVDVLRGSLLNFEKDVEVIHPSKLLIVPIGEHTFKTNSIVLDFTGGDEMPSMDPRVASDRIPEPGAILIFDGEGKLQLLDETEDVEGFRRYLPPKPVEVAPSTDGSIVPGEFPGGGLLDAPTRPTRPGRNRASQP